MSCPLICRGIGDCGVVLLVTTPWPAQELTPLAHVGMENEHQHSCGKMTAPMKRDNQTNQSISVQLEDATHMVEEVFTSRDIHPDLTFYPLECLLAHPKTV